MQKETQVNKMPHMIKMQFLILAYANGNKKNDTMYVKMLLFFRTYKAKTKLPNISELEKEWMKYSKA